MLTYMLSGVVSPGELRVEGRKQTDVGKDLFFFFDDIHGGLLLQ